MQIVRGLLFGGSHKEHRRDPRLVTTPHAAHLGCSWRRVVGHEDENGDVALNVGASDESAPPLLLMHGITSSRGRGNGSAPVVGPLPMLSLDFRGHGSSGRAPNDISHRRT
jgi:pimeloyl-ACP methyl ester carboxylesterase